MNENHVCAHTVREKEEKDRTQKSGENKNTRAMHEESEMKGNGDIIGRETHHVTYSVSLTCVSIGTSRDLSVIRLCDAK